MRVVVTGASGFLGRAVMQCVTQAGFECIGVSRTRHAGLHQVSSYAEAPAGDVLIHLAQTNDRATANAQGQALETEANQTLKSLLAKSYSKVVYASSAVLYGDHIAAARHVSEPIIATDTYTQIKLNSEYAVLAHGGAVARLSNLYGLAMAPGNVLSHILTQLGKGPSIVLHTLEPVRDFCTLPMRHKPCA
ncbi:MAG: NAD(P)-dependent oxidoreductase [Limnobacter sp.]|nr:NAD(P)-dependent oxidoreductase [Limnobacter sp.]